ncbi:ABC transporter permease [Janibacter indicus]
MSTTTAPSTTTDPTPAPAPIDLAGDRIPFARLVGVEVRKMVDTRAGMWMLITMAAISFVVCGVLIAVGEGDDISMATFLGFITMPMLVLLPIMGIMSATQEWSQRTGLATFTLVPRRGRVLSAKVVASLVLALGLLVVAALAAALSTLVSGGGFALEGLSVPGLVLTALIFTLQGVAFGAALLNTPLAIVTSLALPTVWTMLTSMSERMSDIAQWLDLNIVTGPLVEGTMTGSDWGHLATGGLAWVGVPLAIGTYRVLTREIK